MPSPQPGWESNHCWRNPGGREEHRPIDGDAPGTSSRVASDEIGSPTRFARVSQVAIFHGFVTDRCGQSGNRVVSRNLAARSSAGPSRSTIPREVLARPIRRLDPFQPCNSSAPLDLRQQVESGTHPTRPDLTRLATLRGGKCPYRLTSEEAAAFAVEHGRGCGGHRGVSHVGSRQGRIRPTGARVCQLRRRDCRHAGVSRPARTDMRLAHSRRPNHLIGPGRVVIAEDPRRPGGPFRRALGSAPSASSARTQATGRRQPRPRADSGPPACACDRPVALRAGRPRRLPRAVLPAAGGLPVPARRLVSPSEG